MKKVVYGTIILFVAIMIAVIVIASMHEVVQVEYRNGVVVESPE